MVQNDHKHRKVKVTYMYPIYVLVSTSHNFLSIFALRPAFSDFVGIYAALQLGPMLTCVIGSNGGWGGGGGGESGL